MFKVIGILLLIWAVVIGSEFLVAAMSHDMNVIVVQGVNEMAATSNLSNYPGIEGAWRSFSVWKWFLTPVIGLILTGYILYKNREELRSGI
jgi:hypothetical protein